MRESSLEEYKRDRSSKRNTYIQNLYLFTLNTYIHTYTHTDIYIYVFNKYAYGLFINDMKKDRHTHTHADTHITIVHR